MPHRVVLGSSEAAAASVFGQEPGEFYVSTYDDVARLEDLDGLRVLQLAGGAGFEAALDQALSLLADGHALQVTVEYRPVVGALRSRLAQWPAMRLTAPRLVAGVPVVDVTLSHGDPAEDPAWELLELLAAQPEAVAADLESGVAQAAIPATFPGTAAVSAAVRAGGARREPEPSVSLSARARRLLGRLPGGNSRRGRLGVLAALGLVALLILAGLLALIGSSDLGADGVLVALLLCLAAAQALTVGLVLVVLRSQRRAQSAQEAIGRGLHDRILRRTDRIFDHSRRTRQELAAELEFVHQYLAELARQQAAALRRVDDETR